MATSSGFHVTSRSQSAREIMMRHLRKSSALALGAALALGGCAALAPPPPPPPLLPPATVVPVTPAYVQGEVIDGQAARVKKARAAGL
jgi:multidrug efflux pump subunit AcrA (membrane-fusion protein)